MWQDDITTFGLAAVSAANAAASAAASAASAVAAVAIRPANSVVSIVTLTVASQIVAPANPNRRQLILWNDSGAVIYVKFGVAATTSSFTVRIPANQGYEIPLDGYAGDVSAVRASGTGPLIVTVVTV